jgi:hypothetical protein
MAVVGEYSSQDKSTGLFVQLTTNLQGDVGNRFILKSGGYPKGVWLKVCPFCGGDLMSKDERQSIENSHTLVQNTAIYSDLEKQ